jgi:hypothetical protein
LSQIPGDLALIINQFVNERPRKNRGINVDIFISRDSFHNILEKIKTEDYSSSFWIEKKLQSTVRNQGNYDSGLYFLEYYDSFFPQRDRKDGKAIVLELNHNSFCLISSYRRNQHGKIAANILSKTYPNSSRAFVTSNEMYQILREADLRFGYDLKVRQEYSRETTIQAESAMGYHGRPVEQLPSVEEVFKIRKNARRYLTMCKLIAGNPKTPLEITFSGEGHLGLYNGSFEEIFEAFIYPIAEAGIRRVKKFSGRSMSESPDRRPKPITIVFDSQPFSSTEEISQVIDHIKSYTHCNYSVVHSGNPHLYMYIMDNVDYSTFSVRTLGIDKLVVSPQTRTSAESMIRFTNHILSLSNLGNGSIENEEA